MCNETIVRNGTAANIHWEGNNKNSPSVIYLPCWLLNKDRNILSTRNTCYTSDSVISKLYDWDMCSNVCK